MGGGLLSLRIDRRGEDGLTLAYSDRGTTGSPGTRGSPSIFVPVQYEQLV